MFIISCILCSLITFYAANAAPASYLIDLRNLTLRQCPHYESLTKSPFLDQCSDEHPIHLNWQDRNAILCWMYSSVFNNFCISTNLASVYQSEGNLTKVFQEDSLEPSRNLLKVCNSLQRISPSVLTIDVVKMFNDSKKCPWLCSDFDTGAVVDVCTLTSVMWELTEKYTVKETTVGKVSQQETTNSSEKIRNPIKSKPGIDTELKDKSNIEAVVNKANKESVVNQKHSPKESAIDKKPDAHQTNEDNPTIVDQAEDNFKGSRPSENFLSNSLPDKPNQLETKNVEAQHIPLLTDKVSDHNNENPEPKSSKNVATQHIPLITDKVSDHNNDYPEPKPSKNGEAQHIPLTTDKVSDHNNEYLEPKPSKELKTPKDKKNSQKVTEHRNSGPVTTAEDTKSLPDKPNLSGSKNVEVRNNSVITDKASNHDNENTEPKTQSDVQKIRNNQDENNLGIPNVDGISNPKDTPVDSKKNVIPNVKDPSTISQVVPHDEEEKKIDDIPDTKGEDINLEGDLEDEDPKYEGMDNDEPPLLQKTTKGKGDNAEEDGDEPPLPKYGEVKNKVDVVKPKEIDEDNLNIAANYQNQNIDDSDSYFFSYFMMVCVVFIFGYVAYHNKQKILALVLEGRRGRRSSRTRRPNSSNYRKLDSTLEEAVTSSCNKNSTQVIY